MNIHESQAYPCPEHIGTGLTPTDFFCHGHESDLQQRFHNLHCQALGCSRALRGVERYEDILLLPPRTRIERLLAKLDWKR